MLRSSLTNLLRLQTAKRFGLTVSINKAKFLKQARPEGHTAGGSMTADGTALNTVDHFCYLGSMLSSDETLILRLNLGYSLLSVASNIDSGGILESSCRQRSVFTIVLRILLHGRETWTIYRHHIKTRTVSSQMSLSDRPL